MCSSDLFPSHDKFWLVLDIHPHFCIELGVEFGIASAYMALAGRRVGAKVIGIDHNYHDIPGEQIPKYLQNYTYVVKDTANALCDVMRVIRRRGVGIVFQDSSHHYTASQTEWNIYRPMLMSGSVWVCDDILPAFHDAKVDPPGKGMVQYFQSLPGDKMLFPDVLNKGNCVGVVLL